PAAWSSPGTARSSPRSCRRASSARSADPPARRAGSVTSMRRAVAVIGAVAGLLAGCGDDGDDGGLAAPTTTRPPPGVPTTLAPGPAPPAEVDLSLTQVAEADGPSTLVARPGSDVLYVGEIEGRVRPLEGGELGEPVLDISDDVVAGGEQGLLGLAFSPDGDTLYVSYSLAPDGDTRVDAWAMRGDEVDTGSQRTLLALEQPYSNHNGGHLAIGPDGHLYVGLGDGGGGGDPEENGQDPTALLGSILRIDPERPAAGKPYGIPDDNPFGDGDGGAPEVWLYGV